MLHLNKPYATGHAIPGRHDHLQSESVEIMRSEGVAIAEMLESIVQFEKGQT